MSRRSVSARVATAVTSLRGDGRGLILLAVSTGWLLGLGTRLVFPAVLPYIRTEFGMDLPMAGLLLSTLSVGYALLQFPGGLAADRFGERNVLVTGIAVTTAGVLGVVVAPDVVSFFVATVLVGIGMGMYATTRITILSDTFPERSGTAIGFNQAAGNVGTTVMPSVAGFLAVYVGWRWGFGVAAPFFVLVAALLWSALPSRTSTPAAFDRTDIRASLRPLRRAFAHPSVLYVTVTMMMASFIYGGFTGFFPTYLDTQKGLDAEVAATLLGVFFATAVVVQPVAGMVRDRFGARRTLVGILVSTALFLAALPFAAGLPALVAITVLLSVQLAFWPVGNSYVADVVPDDIQGTTVGLSRTFFLLVGAVGPTFVGVAADAGGFDEAFLALAGVALVGVLPASRLLPVDE
jgi:MFS family permease